MAKEDIGIGKAYRTIDELFYGVHESLRERGVFPEGVTGITGVCEALPSDGQGNLMYFAKIVISTKKGVLTYVVDYLAAFPSEFENVTDSDEQSKLALHKTVQVVGFVRSWLEEVCLDGVKGDPETIIPAFIGYDKRFVPLNEFPRYTQ